MSEGLTCYEQDEELCSDEMCLRTGCRLRNGRLRTEQQMPARIWVMDDKDHPFRVPTYSKRLPKNPNAKVTVFYRSDIAERMAEALERSLSWLTSYPGDGALGAYEQARSALTAFKSATKDTEARHD